MIKIRMGMCGVSGTSLMFLSELLDGSGEWETNPGCADSPESNEYQGSPHLVYCEEGSEISSRYYNENSILFTKSYIERFLPYVDCPEVYQMDISDEESYQFVFDLRFYKKYLNGDFSNNEIRNKIDESNIDLSEFPYLNKYSSPVIHWVHNNQKPSKNFLLKQYIKMNTENSVKYRSGYNLVNDIKDLTNIDEVDRLDWRYNADEIRKYTELYIINYADLFLHQKNTGTIFDKYQKQIKEYTKRNQDLLDAFFVDVDLF